MGGHRFPLSPHRGRGQSEGGATLPHPSLEGGGREGAPSREGKNDSGLRAGHPPSIPLPLTFRSHRGERQTEGSFQSLPPSPCIPLPPPGGEELDVRGRGEGEGARCALRLRGQTTRVSFPSGGFHEKTFPRCVHGRGLPRPQRLLLPRHGAAGRDLHHSQPRPGGVPAPHHVRRQPVEQRHRRVPVVVRGRHHRFRPHRLPHLHRPRNVHRVPHRHRPER